MAGENLYRDTKPRNLGLTLGALALGAAAILGYRAWSTPVVEPTESVAVVQEAEQPKEEVKRYNFQSTENLKRYIDLKKGEFERNATVAVTNLEEYHVLAHRIVDDVVSIEEHVLEELKREYNAVEALEQKDTTKTATERTYRQGRIDALEILRKETGALLESLSGTTSQPQTAEDPAKKVDEQLQRLDKAFQEPEQQPETSYRDLNNAAGKVYALMAALNVIPTSLDVPVTPAMPEVQEVDGPARLYVDLTRLANERETEMNSFLDERIASLRTELRNQISATAHMGTYGSLIKTKTGSLETKHDEFEQSVGWTEAETQRLQTLLGESE